MQENVDVVIAGAGPVGLLAAVELTLAGARVLVLERLAAASTVSKALGIGPLGLEALRRRGMGEALADEAARTVDAIRAFMERGAGGMPDRGKSSGHFAGLTIPKDAQAEPERHGLPIAQQAIEAMLAERALALDIEVRRACEVTGFVERPDGVDVDCASAAGARRIRCAYLVGCDGGRSRVRKLAGFAFPGAPATMTMYTAVGEVDHPERLLPMGWRHTPRGVFFYGPLPRRLGMLDFTGPPADRDVPVTRDEIEDVLRRISGADVRVTALDSVGRWADSARLVESYRRGRVLLAGDAAHIHSPFGGQGMSLGLVDAANLGWKLAAVVRGAAPDALLDSYTAERRPAAAAVLANTLAQAALMRPDPQSSALRDLVGGLMRFDAVGGSIGAMVTGLATRYDLGGKHHRVGRLIGDAPVDGGRSLYDAMQDGRGVLVDASRDGAATRLVAARTPRVRSLAVESGPSMLIRPDACVAWVGDGDDDTSGLDDALRRWFAPRPDDDAVTSKHAIEPRAA